MVAATVSSGRQDEKRLKKERDIKNKWEKGEKKKRQSSVNKIRGEQSWIAAGKVWTKNWDKRVASEIKGVNFIFFFFFVWNRVKRGELLWKIKRRAKKSVDRESDISMRRGIGILIKRVLFLFFFFYMCVFLSLFSSARAREFPITFWSRDLDTTEISS